MRYPAIPLSGRPSPARHPLDGETADGTESAVLILRLPGPAPCPGACREVTRPSPAGLPRSCHPAPRPRHRRGPVGCRIRSWRHRRGVPTTQPAGPVGDGGVPPAEDRLQPLVEVGGIEGDRVATHRMCAIARVASRDVTAVRGSPRGPSRSGRGWRDSSHRRSSTPAPPWSRGRGPGYRRDGRSRSGSATAPRRA